MTALGVVLAVLASALGVLGIEREMRGYHLYNDALARACYVVLTASIAALLIGYIQS